MAHELGHVALHSEAERGPKVVEDQAHRFAGAFLAPRDAIYDELPVSINWRDYWELKLKWGLSLAALIRRARDVGKLTKERYALAMKYRSAQGWRYEEPGHRLRPLTRPRMLAIALDRSALEHQDLANIVGLPRDIIDKIIGLGPEPVVDF